MSPTLADCFLHKQLPAVVRKPPAQVMMVQSPVSVLPVLHRLVLSDDPKALIHGGTVTSDIRLEQIGGCILMSSRSGVKIQSDARSQISTAHDHDVEQIHGDDVQLEDLTVQSHGDVQLEDLILGSGPTRGGGQEDATTPGAGDGIHTMILEESKTGKYKKYEDTLLGDISKQEKKHPVICLLDMTLDEKLTTEFSSSPRPTPVKSLGEIATSPFTVPGLSDGGAVQFDDKFPQDDDVKDVSVSGSRVHEDAPVITKDEFLEKMTRVNEFLEMSQNEQLDLEQMRQIFEVEVEAIADPGGRR